MNLSLLKFLSQDAEGAALDVIHHYRIDSWFPAWLGPFIIVGLIALTIWQYRRQVRLTLPQRSTLIIFRVLAYAMIILILARPTLEVEGEGIQPGAVPVIVDATRSMEMPDVGNRLRYDAASEFANSLQQAATDFPELSLDIYRAGAEFGPFDGDSPQAPDGESTSLNRMLQDGQRDHMGGYLPGMILITDGAHNAPEQVDAAADQAKAANIRIYTIGVGEERSRDLAIPFILAEDVVFKGETARIYVNLAQRGYSGQSADVRLFLDDQQIAQEDVAVGEDGEITVPLEYIPEKVGNFELRAEVMEKADEVTPLNNVYQKNIRVIDEKIRVLCVFGTPTREYLYLKVALERDNRVEHSIYLQDIDPRVIGRGTDESLLPELPDQAEQLNGNYDLIIVSAINMMLLPPSFQDALAAFVRDHAGGLVLISDSTLIPWTCRNTPLEPLVPVSLSPGLGRSFRQELGTSRTEPYTFQLTDEGMTNQLVLFSGQVEQNKKIWESFPPSYRIYEGRPKPGAVSLLVSFRNQHQQEFPAIIQQSYGKGAVLFMGFDSTWRWRREYGDRYFRDYWGKVVQFLGLPHLLNESARNTLFLSHETAAVGERVTITAKLANPDYSPYLAERVRVRRIFGDESADLELHPVPSRPGMYRATDWPRVAGDVQFSLPSDFQAAPVSLRVLQQSREFLESGLNRPLLTQLAEKTSGQYLQLADTDPKQLLQTISDARRPQPVHITDAMWDKWPILLLCMLLFGCEWLFRKLFYLD